MQLMYNCIVGIIQIIYFAGNAENPTANVQNVAVGDKTGKLLQ